MKYSLLLLLALPLVANAQDEVSGQPQIQVQEEVPVEQAPPVIGQPVEAAPVDDAYSPATQILKEQAPNFPQEQVPQGFENAPALGPAEGPAVEEAAPVTTTPEPETIAPQLIDTKKAELQILDKIDARVENVDVDVDKEKTYHELKIEVKRCVRSPQESKEENMVFMRIWDVGQGDYTNIVFSGWMLSSNPALHSFEHPIYDVVLLKCMD